MDKQQRINTIFDILVQFEKIFEPESGVTPETYMNYLDRLYVWYLGYGNEEIYTSIKGLRELGVNAEHSTVRRMVFHMINILDGGG